jgi:hypothetical protein
MVEAVLGEKEAKVLVERLLLALLHCLKEKQVVRIAPKGGRDGFSILCCNENKKPVVSPSGA